MGIRKIFVVVAAFLSVASSANICNEVTGTPSKFGIKSTNVFTVDVEMVSKERNLVQNMMLYYDNRLNFTRMTLYTNQQKTDHFFYFTDNEILTFDYSKGRGACTVSTLSSSLDLYLLGGLPSSQGKSVIPSPLAAIHFMGPSGFGNDPIVQTKIGTTKRRGKNVVAYTSCQKWVTKNNNIVLNVTHYFAANNLVFPGYKPKDLSTLLSIDVTGTGTVKGLSNIKIQHTYNYFNFQAMIKSQNTYETPNGVVCAGRKETRAFPVLPNHIRFTAEVVDLIHGVMFTQDEIYDLDRKMAIFRTSKDPNSVTDLKRFTTVIDTQTGYKYNRDNKMKVCTKQLLNNTAKLYPAYSVMNGKAAMFTPKQFFRADGSNFAYLGQKMIRGMQTDAWVAQENSFTVQWHFAPAVSSWNDGNADYRKNKYRMPVKFIFWPDKTIKKHVTTNIFHVDFNAVRPDFVDISRCFEFNQIYQLVLKGSRLDIQASDLEAFKYEAYKQIEKVGKVNWVQINQMKLYYLTNDVVVTFTIASDSSNELKTFASRFLQATKNGQLALKVVDPKTLTFTKTLPVAKFQTGIVFDDTVVSRQVSKYQQAASQKSSGTRYSSGAMGGLAFGMLVVGILGGTGSGYLYIRQRGELA